MNEPEVDALGGVTKFIDARPGASQLEFCHSPELGKLSEAMSLVQGSLGHAEKDSTNPHFRSKYADLASCYDASRQALSEHKVAVVGGPGVARDGRQYFTTMIIHGGEWIKCSSEIHCKKGDRDDPQIMGQWITYTRRYQLASLIGLAQADSDGDVGQHDKANNMAVGKAGPPPKARFGKAAAEEKLK